MTRTILLVSERQRPIWAFESVCSQNGFGTFSAGHRNDALQILLIHPVDVVIYDAELAAADAYQLCYKMKRNDKLKNIPVVICCAGINNDEMQMARDMGADVFVCPDQDPVALMKHIDEILSNPGEYAGFMRPEGMSTEAMVIFNEDLVARLELQNNQLLKAKDELEHTVKMLNDAQQIAHIGSWELDVPALEVSWSDEIYKILGTDRDETQASVEAFLAYVHPDERDAVSHIVENSIRYGQNVEFKCRIVRKSNEVRQLYVCAKFTMASNGMPLRAFGILHDVTDRHLAEQQVLKLNTELEERVQQRTEALLDANQQLESFAYTVSHDLRAPLRTIAGFTKLLEEKIGPKADEEEKRLLQRILSGADKMGELITDLLSFSKLAKNSVSTTEVDMNEVLVGAWASVIVGMQKAPQLKATPLPVVKADRAMITQVLVNFLSNAAKYSGRSSSPVVEVGACKNDTEAIIYVKDNGVGFDMKMYDKLFGVFQRLHPASQFEGTGVGLAIVKRIIDKHRGRVWAEGEPGKGATFYFALPA